MTDVLTDFWVHTITLQRRTGAGAYATAYADPVELTGFVDDGQRLVVNMAGEQVTSTATVYLPASTVARMFGAGPYGSGTFDGSVVPVESKVTLPAIFGGRTSEVVAVSFRESGPLGLPDHLELSLR